jgi:hypothetical protein
MKWMSGDKKMEKDDKWRISGIYWCINLGKKNGNID